MRFTLGIDLGTSYFKFALFDSQNKLCGLSRILVEKDTGKGELCELPAERFFDYIKDGIALACSDAKANPDQIISIGYSSQANSFILLDSNDKPLTPLVLWPDNRCEKIHPQVKELWDQPQFQQTTGIGMDAATQFCINKLLWFKHNRQQLWSKAKSIMTISDYLTFLFTGKKIGDRGAASLLGLMDSRTGQWWGKAFDILGIDETLFSARCQVGTEAGDLTGAISNSLGIKKTASFYIGSLDHHMAALGAGLGQIADMSESIGTVIACVNFTEKYNPTKGVCISPWRNGKYCQLTFDANGTASLDWYQKNFAVKYKISELVKIAEKTDPSQALVARSMAFQYKTIEQVFSGIEKFHHHGHFIRALMESSAQTLTELVNKLSPDTKPVKIVATGGGAKSDLWLKIKSDLIGSSIIRSEFEEPACRGAALICKKKNRRD